MGEQVVNRDAKKREREREREKADVQILADYDYYK